MASKHLDTEKTFPTHHTEEHRGSPAVTYLPKEDLLYVRKKDALWKRPSIIALVLIIGLLVITLAAKNSTITLWRGIWMSGESKPLSEDIQSLHDAQKTSSSWFKTPPAASEYVEPLVGTGIEGDPTLSLEKPESSVLNGTAGVSIAASRDQDSRVQLFDLSSSGVIRLHKSRGSIPYWYDPEIVPADPAPKDKSPMAATAWRGANGTSNVRLYYLDVNNRIVELASTSCAVDSPCTWSRTTYFNDTASGGLSAQWVGDHGIRVYYTTSEGALMNKVWYGGIWRTPNWTGFTVLPNSDLSTWLIPSDTDIPNAVYIMCVDLSGALVEIFWKRGQGDRLFRKGRTIDATFNSTRPNASFAAVYGDVDKTARAYYLSEFGSMERTAVNGTDWSTGWWQLTDSTKSDVPGGSVAAISLGNQVEVFYTSKKSIIEIALDGIWKNEGPIR